MSNTSRLEIEMRAYELWENRGKPWGTPEVDWLKAETEFAADASTLSKVAREVGSAVGAVVAFFSDGNDAPAARP